MKTVNKLKLLSFTLLMLISFGCNDDSSNDINNEGNAKISIKLVDEPGDFEHVYVDVRDVMVKVNDDSDDESGWTSLGANAGVYDLLELTGGLNEVLVEDYEVPSGILNQIRLVLGDANEVVIDGETFPLNTPSAQQSGLKIKVNQELEAGFTYNFILDFDVERSVIIAGNSGNINLKPVINASVETTSGKIQGAITPFDFQTMVSIEVDGEIRSTYTNENGLFVLNGIPAGVYEVTVTPDESSGYAETLLSDIEVVNGLITDVGLVTLELLPTTGTIVGTITNDGVDVTVSIMVDGENVSVMTNEEGVFIFEDVDPGTYTVIITPNEASGLTEMQISDVTVSAGELTDLGEITLGWFFKLK